MQIDAAALFQVVMHAWLAFVVLEIKCLSLGFGVKQTLQRIWALLSESLSMYFALNAHFL